MDRICLDTDFLVDFLRNKKEALAFIKEKEKNNVLSTTYINLFELYHGAFKSGRTKNIFFLEQLTNRLTILNLSKESVKYAGELLAEFEKKGELIDFRDLLIGTIAFTNNFLIKTNNIKHFNKIKELKIISNSKSKPL